MPASSPPPRTCHDVLEDFAFAHFSELSAGRLDVSASANATTYFEWETEGGFVSLEVGTTHWAFSFISLKLFGHRGFSGRILDTESLASLLLTYPPKGA